MAGLRIALIAACSVLMSVSIGDAKEPSPADVRFFEKHVRPLLVTRCYSCHSVRDDSREGGLLLDSREGWMAGGNTGKAIVPGDIAKSRLIAAVRYDDPQLQMPPDRALSKDEVLILERWVLMGAPDPRDGKATPPVRHASDPDAGRQHWAFRPLHPARPRVPSGHSSPSAWSRSPLDDYVLAAMNREGLQPAPDADRRALARRVYFQITGLPPSSSEMRDFLTDGRPGAYERLVDQLLASPEFGRRWGRHWLDLARYADSNGLDENFLFREAWRYRNWVIDAVNQDLPYDQFLLQQIAGDLLPFDSVEQRDRQRTASGFLVMGPKVLLGNNPQERRMDVADEQLDTLGQTVLGQTIGCARCHDHKFDPIPTADYYAMAGIFTSTNAMEQRYMLGQQRTMERLEGLGPVGEKLDADYEKYWRELPALKQRLAKAKSALELAQKGDFKALVQLAKEHQDAVAAGARDDKRSAEARTKSQADWVGSLQNAVDKPPAIPARAMVPAESSPADEHIRLAGQFDRLGEQVPRGFLQVVGSEGYEIPADASGRLQLARWIVDPHHGAGRLAARVMANRIWHHLIGRGIVRTVDNFGRTGETPTHPALLDYLASELMRGRWSVKALVRKVVLSRTFQMSSRHDAAAHAIDPDNQWLWRANRRRLSPEAFRDAMLSAAGGLDRNAMGSTVWYLGDQATAVGANTNRRRTDFPCRSVYLPVIRNDLPTLFDVFDFADPHATTGMRPQTMVATQGLFLLNDASMAEAAKAMAGQLLNNGQAEPAPNNHQLVEQLFMTTIHRKPSAQQEASLVDFVERAKQLVHNASPAGDAAQKNEEEVLLEAWSLACHAVFASSQFQILD